MAIQWPVTICALFYGEHAALCRRFLASLYTLTAPELFHLRAGLNAVCQESQRLVANAAEMEGNVTVTSSDENIYKLPMMRRLFSEPRIETEWTIWFDDDSFPNRADWLQTLSLAIEASPDVAMWGAPRIMTPDQPLLDFTREAPWFRGREFIRNPETDEINFEFIVGGYWAAKTKIIRALNWPDSRLVHFEDDYLLGEALRQNGHEIGRCESGVVIDCAARRCPPETPRVRSSQMGHA